MSAPQRPGHIRLTGNSGQGIDLTIGKISGDVVFAQQTTITRSAESNNPGSRPKPRRRNRNRNQKCDSDSFSSSSSDSEAEAFFARHGAQMPSKNVFRNIPQYANTPNASQMVIEGGQTTAVDHEGNPIRFSPAVHQPNPSLPPRNRRPAAEKQAEAALPHPPAYPCTTYERQTQKYLKVMELMSLTASSNLSKPLGERKILDISTQLGQGWRRVFRFLGVSDAEIDVVHQGSREVQGSVYMLLMDWSKRCGPPSVHFLVEALVRADYAHVVQCLK